MHWTRGRYARKELIEVALEFVEQRVELGIVELPGGGDVGRVDDRRPMLPHQVERRIEQDVGRRVIAGEMFPHDTDACTAEAVTIERRRVVRERVATAGLRCGVAGIDAGKSAEQDRHVANGPGQ